MYNVVLTEHVQTTVNWTKDWHFYMFLIITPLIKELLRRTRNVYISNMYPDKFSCFILVRKIKTREATRSQSRTCKVAHKLDLLLSIVYSTLYHASYFGKLLNNESTKSCWKHKNNLFFRYLRIQNNSRNSHACRRP